MKGLLKENLNLKDKKVLLRVDLNVPLKNASVTETNRIEKIIPTIKFLLEKKAKIIIISHLGRPGGKIVPKLSLEPISKKMSEILNNNVVFLKDKIDEKLLDKLNSISNNSIVMLENLRFYKGEESNNLDFAKKLSKIADIYINDAFSCCHRAHASIEAITNFLPSYFGIQIIEEIDILKKLTSDIKKPVACIIGGSKISTKIGVISNLIKKFDSIIIVGGMANTILKEIGFNIGKSICENGCEKIVKKIFEDAKKYNCNILYPSDLIVSKKLNTKGINKGIKKIQNDDIILDIGPETILSIKKIVSNSNTIFWNGPAGLFENSLFENGTKEIAKIIADKTKKDKIFSVAGGGDTVAALNKFNLFKSFSFISTAGGAFLEFLEGKELPGIKTIN